MRYPQDEISTGYATSLDVAIRRYAELSGSPFSFIRTTVAWRNLYTPDTTFEVTPLCVIVRLPLATWAGVRLTRKETTSLLASVALVPAGPDFDFGPFLLQP